MTTPGASASPSRASLLTPPGRGAVAVIAAEGPAAIAAVDAHFRAANCLPLGNQPINRIVFGHWTESMAAANGAGRREEVVVCLIGAARLEVHCHGGVAAAERILGAMAAAGCQVQSWTEWLGAETACPINAAAEAALPFALTRRTAAILLDQRHGALQRELEAARSELAAGTPAGIDASRRRISALLDCAPLGLHLTRPWHVAIAGRPNVGKSSLINALVGYQRAIVFDQPGTTRDVLAAETAIDGCPVRLTDGAGLRAPADDLEAAGVDLAKQQLQRADLVVWVLDASRLSSRDLADPAAAALREMKEEVGAPLSQASLAVVNKADLAAARVACETVWTCALTGAGLDALLAAIACRLVPGPVPTGSAVPFSERHVGALKQNLDQASQGQTDAAIAVLEALLCLPTA